MTNPADTADFFALLSSARAVRAALRARALTVTTKQCAQIAAAIEVAAGKREVPEKALRIIGAEKDLNARGIGPISYRMVYRGGWQYVSTERLPTGRFLAADRRAKVYGKVYAGEIVVEHDHGCPIGHAWLAVGTLGVGPGPRWGIKIEFTRLRTGLLRFKLPDGQTIDLPNPRS